MQLGIAKAIVEAGQDLGLDIEIREEYSGRGMYGDKTSGIIYNDLSDLLQSVAGAVVNLTQAYNEDEEESDENIHPDTFVHDLCNLHTDNMGRSGIIY